MSRYIKKFQRIGSLGPSEERGFALWVGYDLEGIDDDLSSAGLVKVDEWSGDELAKYRVSSFTHVERGDAAMYARLGISAPADDRQKE